MAALRPAASLGRAIEAPRQAGSRLVRLLDILRLTGAERGWTAVRLSRHLGVSLRRIFEDFQLLHRAGLPVIADPSGYRPLHRDLYMPVRLTVVEALALLRPLGNDGPARSGRLKVANILPAGLRKLFSAPERVRSAALASPVSSEVCAPVDEALADERKLRVRYRGTRDRAARERVIEPRVLFLRGTGWYLAAWSADASDWRLFRLDRIESAIVLREPIEPKEGFDLERYLGQTAGVWRGGALDARVEVLPSHFAAVRSEGLARGMAMRKTGDGGVLEIEHGHVDEVAWWLAQFGEGVRVLAPVELRRRLAAVGRRIVELNGG